MKKAKSGLKEMGLLDVEGAAAYLNVSLGTFKQIIAKEIKPVDLHTKQNFYSVDSLKAWVEARVKRSHTAVTV